MALTQMALDSLDFELPFSHESMKRVEQFLLATVLLLAMWATFLVVDLRSCSWRHSDSKLKMLLIGDPQIEGNASWDKKSGLQRLMTVLNDLYMKVIVSNLVYNLQPSYVAVMGDLFSYQGTTDDEFDERLVRYRDIFESALSTSSIINVTGNHDLGYGDEISEKVITRFEKSFGSSNFHFHYPLGLDLNNDSKVDMATFGILNNLLMDPSRERGIQYDVWAFTGELASLRKQRPHEPLIILSHIPLYKQIGCVDKPFTLWSDSGYVRKQNQLSQLSTHHILDFVEPDVILMGHDHHGCVYNHTNKHGKHIAEYTIRSIMGDYSGTGALLEFHDYNGTWVHDFQYCYFVPFRLITTMTVISFVLLILSLIYILVSKCLCQCMARA
jgi:hypothetical protein